jgi:hypothetical protein
MNAFIPQFGRTPDVVSVVRVTSVDNNIVLFQERHDVVDRLVHHPGWNHQPDCARPGKSRNKILDRPHSCSPVIFQGLHRFRVPVVYDTFMPGLDQPPRHVCTHSSEPYHADLHAAPPDFSARPRFYNLFQALAFFCENYTRLFNQIKVLMSKRSAMTALKYMTLFQLSSFIPTENNR